MVNKTEFGYWLQQEREKRGWSQADLARMAGLNRAVINKTENGISEATPNTLTALAEPLGYSPIYLFRKAGLLPPGPSDEVAFEDWKYILDQLDPRDQEILKKTALNMIEADKKEKQKNARTKPASATR